jgi:hypothetical protein
MKNFTDKEILEGLEYINQTLSKHDLPLMTLEQYKESLKYPLSEDNIPQMFPRSKKSK